MFDTGWWKRDRSPERLLLVAGSLPKPVDDPSAGEGPYTAQFIKNRTAVRVYADCGCYNTFELRYALPEQVAKVLPKELMGDGCLTPCQRPDKDCIFQWWDAEVCFVEFIRAHQLAVRQEREAKSGNATSNPPTATD